MITRFQILAIALFSLNPVGKVIAAEIIWGTPQNITGTLADFDTTGDLHVAWNGGDNEVVVDPDGLNITFVNGPDLKRGVFKDADRVVRKDASYDALLQDASWGGETQNLKLTGLKLGEKYQVQLWLADTRSQYANRSKTYGSDKGSSTVALDSGPPSQYVIGKFTAKATTQNIQFIGRGKNEPDHPQYNAIMVRKVGEGSKNHPDPKVWTANGLSLLVDVKVNSPPYKDNLMSQIAADIFRVVDTCRQLMGTNPALNNPYKKTIRVRFSYDAKKPIGKMGELGMIFPKSLIDDIYHKYKKGRRVLPLSVLLMATQNCWQEDLDYRIAYKTMRGDRAHDWWMRAVASTIGVMCLNDKKLTIEGAGQKKAVEWADMLRAYQNDENATWFNSYTNSRPPVANSGTLDELLASLLYEVCKKNGGKKFLGKWLAEVSKLDALKTYHHRAAARDNFAIAASRAAGKDLTEYLNNKMKWPCSASKVAQALKK